MHIFKKIHNGDISLEEIEKEQINFKRKLVQIKQGNPKNRSKEQEKTINNATNLSNSREEVVRMFNDYTKNMSKNIYESKHKEPSYAGPSYAGPPHTEPSYTGPSETESTKSLETDEGVDFMAFINELKNLEVSKEHLLDFDEQMDLYINLHSHVKTLEEAEKEQDKLELLLDELNELNKNKLSKNN